MKSSVTLRISVTAFFTISAFVIALFGCKKGGSGTNPAIDATSQLCTQVKGTEAIYWDLMNGIPRTDIPGGLPTVKQIGGNYIHPTYPPLGFIYPAGYSAQTDPNSGWIGAFVIRNDNKSVWIYSGAFLSSAGSPDYYLNAEIASLQSFLQSANSQVTVECSNKGTLPRATGIVTTGSSAFVTFNGFTATVNVTSTTVDGVPGAQIFITATAAPTADFANEVLNTWLPIDYQMLYTGHGVQDSDGDGVPDSEDNFPYDPDKQ
jgi:hypothetical protein